MKRVAVVFALAAMLVATNANAHQGDVRFMFQFPAGLEPTLDGELDDWSIVPEVYYARAENMFNQYGAPLDLSDFNSFTVWGYSLATNKAYLAYWVGDDMIHDTEKWSVTTDWDHTGGQFRSFKDVSDEFKERNSGSQGQRYDLYGPTFASGGYYMKARDKEWAGEPPFLEWGGKYLKGETNTFEPAELQAEVSFVPFDDAHPDGADASIEHPFAVNQIVGIESNWGDKDADPGKYDDAYWSIFGGIGASLNADNFGDYLLAPLEPGLPTAVKGGTWGQVKASFAE
jgi:hypothetical protein